MQTVTVVTEKQKAAPVQTMSDLCRCKSCGRDVRRDLHVAYLSFFLKRVRGALSGSTRNKVSKVAVVCSEICAHRLKRLHPQNVSGWELFHPLDVWFGDRAFTERDDFIRVYRMSRSLRDTVLPRLLHAITLPAVATVIKIRSEMREAISETKEAMAF